jgi:hypothetical protein
MPGFFSGRGVEGSYNHFGAKKEKTTKHERRCLMQPDVSAYMYAWWVWGAIFVFTFLMTFIGTWIIIKKRRWEE